MDDRDVVIVTGPTGFIGSALIEALGKGFRIVGFDQPGPPHPPPIADCVCVDISSEESVQEAFQSVRHWHGERIASVIHLAAYYDFSGEPSPKYEEITVRGTERLLRGLRSFQVEQFIYSSTMLVYVPTQPGRPIQEDWPLDPKWDYPKSKVAAEEIIRAQHGAIPIVLLRIAGVYDDLCHAPVLAHQIQRIYERRLVGQVFAGDLAHGQSFLHLDDLVDALVRLVERRRQLPPELVLLLGEPEMMSYDELQREIGRLVHGEAWETRAVPKPLAKAGAWLRDLAPGEEHFIKPWMVDRADDHYELDIGRARALLGWTPKRRLRDTLPKMIAALKADPLGWYRENELQAPAGQEQAADRSRSEVAQGSAPAFKSKGQGAAATVAPDQAMREHMEMMHAHRQRTLWVHFAIMALGLWLITSPFTLGYLTQEVGPEALRIMAERDLPPPALRQTALAWSDGLSGLLLLAFGALSLSERYGWAQWANVLVGLWLLSAPLVFWTPSPAAYLNDTLVGALVIAFAILIPEMPGMSMEAMMGDPDIPPGWSYCPSTWLQRLPIIALAFVGFFIARYLAAYQMGHIGSAWDPFFGRGTERIITSDVSRAWPVSDAGLGALTYMLEALMGFMGDKRRWRTMPWMVLLFGIVVVPLGVVSIFFIIIQPIMIGTWCTLCLVAALAMLIMIPFALDELVAMGQFLVHSYRAGQPFWSTFFRGGTMPDGAEDQSPGFEASSFREMGRAMAWGVTMPWTLLLSTAIGIWLMFTRLIFGTGGEMADSDHLVGALIVTVAIIAMAEVARPLRFINGLFGLWLILAPWILAGAGAAASWAGVVAGGLLLLLSLPRGRVKEHYGSWDRYIV
jgi:nucleoside-diphosphate-sugar epimerase